MLKKILHLGVLFYFGFINLVSLNIYPWAKHFSHIFLLILYLITRVQKQNNILKTPLDLFIFFFFLTGVISSLISVNPYRSFELLFTLIDTAILFHLVIYLAQEKLFEQRFIIVFLFVIGVNTFWSFYQYFFALPSLAQTSSGMIAALARTRRTSAGFALPNTFGGWLGLTFPGLIGISILRRKISYYFLTILAFASLLLTFSVGTWLSLGVVGVGVILKTKRRFLFRLALMLSLCLFLLSLAVKRIEVINLFSPESSFCQRVYNWQTAFRIAQAYPFGCGLGTYGVVLPNYKSLLENETQHVHNSYLEILAEQGFLGLFTYLLLLGAIGRLVLYPLPQKDKVFVISLLLGLTTYIIHNLLDFDFYIPNLALLFWLFLGIVFSKVKKYQIYSLSSKARVLSLFLGGVFIILQSCFYQSEIYFKRARQAKAERLEYSRQNYLKALQLNPLNDSLHFELGQLYLVKALLLRPDRAREEEMKKYFNTAIHHYREAIRLNRTQPYYHKYLGMAYYHQAGSKLTPLALSEFKRAKELYPSSPKYYELLAQIYAENKLYKEAQREYKQLLKIFGFSSEIIRKLQEVTSKTKECKNGC
jgi:O-antigen ligase